MLGETGAMAVEDVEQEDDERTGFICAMILLMKPDNLVKICR